MLHILYKILSIILKAGKKKSTFVSKLISKKGFYK